MLSTDSKQLSIEQDSEASLSDADITSRRVDRRSFFSRAVTAGSLVVGAALVTGCGGEGNGSDSDSAPEETDSDSDSL